ncbi:MAG TPA: sigma-70 family RNA polymerase sigma factor, partial [Candidatus Baltobacteraceae bacterium]|nr:sigma-70 family RNA polymerase sigma factor [Candidatus Baltobacteraceae bacterium]
MQELDDIALLSEYAERDSELAFATLVTRHIDRVYSVALRHTRNPHQAEEITQAVFVILARKSKQLRKGVILEGWLYQTARLTALTFIRSEIRRTRREQEAYMQNVSNESESEVWSQITPLLDAALAGLNETDRNAVVLRFFYGKSMSEIGMTLGANEDTARMRINRAIDKLQKFFSKRGVNSTAEAITGAISAHSVQVAPAILAKVVTSIAIAKGATASTSTLTLIEGALKVMTWTKTKTAIVAGIIVLLAAGTTTVTIKEIQAHRAFPWQTRQYDYSLLDSAKPQLAILPSRYGGNGGFGSSLGGIMGVGEPATSVIEAAYGWFNIPRIVVETKLPGGTYDFIASGPNRNALKDEVRKKFGVVANVETREADVWLLQIKNPGAPNLKPTSHSGQNHVARGEIVLMNASLSQLAYLLENMMRDLPILDRTGSSNDDAPAAKPLQGNKPAIVRRQSPKETFDINLKWDDGKEGQPHNMENLKQA